MFTALRLAHSQFRVLTAFPVDCQHHVAHFIVNIDNNVGDQCTQQLLAHAHGDIRRLPGRLQIVGEVCESACVNFDG